MSNQVILNVDNLSKNFNDKNTSKRALDSVSLSMLDGEILGILGESGSGKSTLAKIIVGLLTPSSGIISFAGNTLAPSIRERTLLQRREIQYVFQNPFSSIDPRFTIQDTLLEPLQIWEKQLSSEEKEKKIYSILDECSLNKEILHKKPRQLSGGQLQRISIARALLIKPRLLIADEIVSALDMSVQNQILTLLKGLKEEHGLSIIFISHDIKVMHKMADRVVVLKNGEIVGRGGFNDIDKLGEYAKQLMDSTYTF